MMEFIPFINLLKKKIYLINETIVSEAYYEPLMLEIPSPMFHSCLWSCVNKPFVSLFNLFLSYLCN